MRSHLPDARSVRRLQHPNDPPEWRFCRVCRRLVRETGRHCERDQPDRCHERRSDQRPPRGNGSQQRRHEHDAGQQHHRRIDEGRRDDRKSSERRDQEPEQHDGLVQPERGRDIEDDERHDPHRGRARGPDNGEQGACHEERDRPEIDSGRRQHESACGERDPDRERQAPGDERMAEAVRASGEPGADAD